DDLFHAVAVDVCAVQLLQFAGCRKRKEKVRAAKDRLRCAAIAFKDTEFVTLRRVFCTSALEGRCKVSRAGLQTSFQGLFQTQAFGGELRDGRLKFAADLRHG